MYLQTVTSKNAVSYYAAKSYYDENGKKSSKIVEKLGTLKELSEIYSDVPAYLKEKIAQLTLEEKNQQRNVVVKFSQSELIDSNSPSRFNCGYLFLQKIYHQLGLDKICSKISEKYKFEYDLDQILSRLVYGRILFPASKLSTLELSQKLLEQPKFELHQIYRALEVLAEESDFIQAELYKNSEKAFGRNNNILYYDCTNYFFEIEEESGIRQYGVSKENRPNPIVEMGLFMDGDGIPLAFCIHPGNTNEQKTLIPLEKSLIHDFGKSKFVVCTDAGLSSTANRRFNHFSSRAFITAQSLKKMKEYQKEWALSKEGWHLPGDPHAYTMEEILENRESNYSNVYYKDTWFKEDGLSQRYIVTFSIKYKEYLENIREKHIQRAQKSVDTGSFQRKHQNDPNRFVDQFYFTEQGEIASNRETFLNQDKIREEALYDGFYCVATDLESPVTDILKVNAGRWEIEESFRIMKSEFKARPVYLQKDERILAHFVTCFISLMIFRLLEKQIHEKVTASALIGTLRNMELYKIPGEGYLPVYTRDDITDLLHETFGFRTDMQMNTLTAMKKIFKDTKKG